jgi:hypothetical protein
MSKHITFTTKVLNAPFCGRNNEDRQGEEEEDE